MVRILALVVVSGFAAWLITPAASEPIASKEIKVSDGDTIRVGKTKYRLVGFDTPETWSRKRKIALHERALGKRARVRLKALLASSGQLDLKDVPCACTKHTTRDEQGNCRTNDRYCAVLSIDGENVGTTLIAEGLAREFVCTDTECPEQLPWPEASAN